MHPNTMNYSRANEFRPVPECPFRVRINAPESPATPLVSGRFFQRVMWRLRQSSMTAQLRGSYAYCNLGAVTHTVIQWHKRILEFSVS